MKSSSVCLVILLLLVSCGETENQYGASGSGVSSDAEISEAIEVVISRNVDLPQELNVEVSNAAVLISGSLLCEDCNGLRTPANIGTVQQSLGAVVRAVNGVTSVEFDLLYQ